MLGEKPKRTFSARPITLLLWLICLIVLSVSATLLIGHAVYMKKSNDKDQQILVAEGNSKSLSDKNIKLQNSLQMLEEKYNNLESRFKDLADSRVRAQRAKRPPSGPPPIEQPLVREGEFAVELANALNLTTSHDEATGESYLASVNILPRNGWMSDYPMTPDKVLKALGKPKVGARRSG